MVADTLPADKCHQIKFKASLYNKYDKNYKHVFASISQ